MNKKVAVIVLGYNSVQYVPSLIQSIMAQDYPYADYYYVDNASYDGSIEMVREIMPDMIAIQNDTNLGYAGAYAKIIDEKFVDGYDAVILLNPDTVLGEGCISTLVRTAFADRTVALAQPKILLMDQECNRTKKINSLGGDVHFLGNGLLRGGKYARKKDASRDHDVFFVSGTCLLIKKEFYQKTGGLDADFFMYLEDVDLSWQAQLLGYRCRVVTQAIVWHQYIFERKDPQRKKFYYLERNRLWCLYKNYTCRTLVLIFPALAIFECGIIAHSLVHHYFWYKMRAYWGCMRSMHVMRRKKKMIQGKRVCSDAEIFARMTDVIKFEAIDGKMLRVANSFFAVYYKIVRRFV